MTDLLGLSPLTSSLSSWRRALDQTTSAEFALSLSEPNLSTLTSRVLDKQRAQRWADPRSTWWRATCALSAAAFYALYAYCAQVKPVTAAELPAGVLPIWAIYALLAGLAVLGGLALWVFGATLMEQVTEASKDLERALKPLAELPRESSFALGLCEKHRSCKEYCAQVARSGRRLYAFDLAFLRRLAFEEEGQLARMNHQKNLELLAGH